MVRKEARPERGERVKERETCSTQVREVALGSVLRWS